MWSQLTIADKPVDVFDPPSSPRSALVFLHGGDLVTIRDNPTYTDLLAELNLACVCPHADWSLWADRICPDFDDTLTPERHVLTNVVPFMERRWSPAPRSIAVAGVGMGGQGALRLGFKYPDRFPVVAGVASWIDYHEWFGGGSAIDDMYDSQEQCRQDTVTLHVRQGHYPPHIFFAVDPDDRDWFRGNDRLHEKLNALGIPHECDLTTRAGGHSWAYFNHMAGPVLRFCQAALTQESRRLL